MKTTDLGLTATLITLGYTVEMDKTNPRVEFIFDDWEEINRITKDYWNKSLKVDPLEYFNNLKILKTRLHEKE